MTKVLTLREASQSFSHCVREVEAGEGFVITRNGTPVARLTPARPRRVLTERQRAALRRLQEIAAEGWPIGAGPLDRDASYDRDAMRCEFSQATGNSDRTR